MLALPAVAVWLAACGLLSWTQLAYDGAVSTNHIYFWVYGGALLLSGLCSQDDGRPAASRTSRWGGALLMLLAAALAYLVVERVGQAGIGYVLYNLQFWWIAAMGLLLLAVTLWQNSRFRRPRRPAHTYPPLARSAAVVLISFLPNRYTYSLLCCTRSQWTRSNRSARPRAENSSAASAASARRLRSAYTFSRMATAGTITMC